MNDGELREVRALRTNRDIVQNERLVDALMGRRNLEWIRRFASGIAGRFVTRLDQRAIEIEKGGSVSRDVDDEESAILG